ncbi:hypothetical protein H8S90_18255 [Olivibacter sp. SDN3]|uniref:hypothetical protein n=1 Tax=Olivibacter sp. SDN3 TaxID=2764720 RepID=UPI0016514DC2|nr:hypothetical protein [Olivibacter sp. SDN3]QNL48710.1 hypothetical protein H8S90_18255 [Olivibacter sp. SDN3]
MKTLKLVIVWACMAFIFAACATKKSSSNEEEEDCPPTPCTMDFRSIGVIFKDAKGDTVSVNNYAVSLKSTGTSLPSASSELSSPEGTGYLVANDGDKSELSVEGDTLIITGTHPLTGEVKTSEIVVSGGRCECHVNRVSGEEVIVFNE